MKKKCRQRHPKKALDNLREDINFMKLFYMERFSIKTQSLGPSNVGFNDKQKEKIMLNQVVPIELIPWKII